MQDVFKFLIFMEFNPFDYRPFLVRERVAVEEFTQESPVWERAWEMYREKVPSVPERMKLDVLNDLRYLLVRAQHTQGEVSIEHCNTLLDEQALREVAGSLLADLKSPTNPFQPDLSLQGEVPERIPYIMLKAGMPVDFLRDAGYYCALSLDADSLHEKLASIGYSEEEITDLLDLFDLAYGQSSIYDKLFNVRKKLFEADNCPVSDKQFVQFWKRLMNEVTRAPQEGNSFIDKYLPLRAAKEAGCLRSVSQGMVNSAFPEVTEQYKNQCSTLNNEKSSLTKPQEARLGELKKVFAPFAPRPGHNADGAIDAKEDDTTDKMADVTI